MGAPEEELYATAFSRLVFRWNEIRNFWEMGSAGFARMAESQLARLNESFDVVESRPDLMKDPTKSLDRSNLPQVAQQIVDGYCRTLESACLIFFHAELDQALLECCQICARMAPDVWALRLSTKKLSIKEIQEKGAEAAILAKIEEDLVDLERRSLPDKASQILAICRPGKDGLPPYSGVVGMASFNLEKLREIDLLRHEVIHKPGHGTTISDFSAIEDFLQKTGLYLWCLLNYKLDIKLDPSIMERLSTGGAKSGAKANLHSGSEVM